MSLSDALWNFFSEPVEAPNDPHTTEQPAEQQPAEQTDNLPVATEQEQEQDPVSEAEAEVDDRQDAGDDAFLWAQQRKKDDKDYWPYAFVPDGPTESIGPDETVQVGTDENGAEEHYAGQWVREMFEAHDLRPDDNTWVGYSQDNVRGVTEAGIEYRSLFRHMAFFGMTGFGKSTVLKNLMVQWAFMGYGFCFIDPKGQDIEELLQILPENRLDDVVWVEPGNEELDKAVGFNFFDTRNEPGQAGFEGEVQEIVDDFVSILRDDGTWGATMDTVAKAVTTQMVRHQDKNFTVLDMYKIIADEDERNEFAERFGDEIEKIYLERMKNYDDSDFDPLLKRLRQWTDNRVTREMVGHRDSSINISDIVEEGKILLVRTSSIPSSDVMSLVATSIVRRIWATIRTRADKEKGTFDPFFIVMDEFDMLTNGEMDIGDMFSKGRSLRLSLCIANQQPTQLPEHVNDALNNCDNLFTFNPGAQNINDAQDLAKSFDLDNMMELFELSQYSLLGRFTVGGDKTDAILVDTFPPYPPRRTAAVAGAVKDRSIEKYGAPRMAKDKSTDSFGLLGREQAEEDDADKIDLESGDTITIPQVLESVHTAGVRNGTRTINEKEGWTAIDGIRNEVTKYTDALDDGVDLDNILEKIPSTLLNDATVGETTYYRLTTEGETKAFVQDSGNSSSAGKAAHRHLLKKGYEAFTQLGYGVSIPNQEGEMPDGEATPPIRPMKDSETFEDAEKLKAKLERKYSRLYELFGDSMVSLEAESTTITKPKQTIKNLAKAMRADQKCAFLVKDGSESKGTFEYWARAGYNILSEPPFVSYKDEDDNRRFYNHTTDSPLKLKDGTYALRKTNENDTVWRDDGDRIVLEDPANKVKHTQNGTLYTYTYSKSGEIILRDPDGNEYSMRFPSWSALKASGDFEETNIPLAIFKDLQDIEEPSASKFPYNYQYDQKSKEYVVRDNRGNIIETYREKDGMTDEFDVIPKPVVPELLFPSGEYPDEDDWVFIIIPDEGKTIGPQVYLGTDETGDSIIEPLFDGDDPYNAIDHDADPSQDDTGGGSAPTNTPDEQNGAETGANPDGEAVPIDPEILHGKKGDDPDTDSDSDGSKPKSNTDVVKNSDEVWTKPEPGDDDYDPSKDNSNYRTGYKPDEMGDDWTGGDARDEDDGSMNGYKTPEEKAEDRLRDEYAKEKGIGGAEPDESDATESDPETDSDSSDDDEQAEPNGETEGNENSVPSLNFSKHRRRRNRKRQRSEDDE